MSHKIISTIILYCLFKSLCLSQSMDHVSYVLKDKSDRPLSSKNIKDLQGLLDRDYVRLHQNEFAIDQFTIYHRMATVHYALDSPSDSIYYYMNKAQQANSQFACKEFVYIHNENEKAPDRFKALYVMTDFDQGWWESFLKDCECIMQYFEKSDINVEKKIIEIDSSILNLEYILALDSLHVKDQFFRMQISKNELKTDSLLELQYVNDSSNRVKLDSLYQIYGFPSVSKVGADAFETSWLILHHSIDCEWNKKWIRIFLDNFNQDDFNRIFLQHTIARFFTSDRAHCNDQNNANQIFRNALRAEYGPQLAERFGFTK